MNERQKKILQLLSLNREVNVVHLSEITGVSGVTIRQDLNELESRGFLKRTHGGAVKIDSDDINSRLLYNYETKLKIAKKASSLIVDNDVVFIESGSTNAILAQSLEHIRNLTVLTSNAFIARECRKNSDHSVILMGGLYQKQSDSVVGQLTKMCIEQFNFAKAFIGVDGFTIEKGFSSKNLERAEIMSAILEKTDMMFVVTDSSKFGRNALCELITPDKINGIITDRNIPDHENRYLQSIGVEVFLV